MKYIMAAVALMAAAANGEDLARTDKTIKLDLAAGTRSIPAFEAVKSLTYSGQAWESAAGGSATVKAQKGGLDVQTLVAAKPGEGFFSFTPVSGGVWTLVHAAAGQTFTASFAVYGADEDREEEPGVETSIVAAETGTLGLDLAAGIRTLADGESAEGLRYSGTGFETAQGGSATVAAELEGASYPLKSTLVDRKSGEGAFTFTPAAGGIWLLTHTDANGGTLTARFKSLSSEATVDEDETGSYEEVLVGMDAGAVGLDLSAAIRQISDLKEIKGITYSASNWEKVSTEVATGIAKLVFDNEAHSVSFEETKLADEGEYAFKPEKAGLWNLTHLAANGIETHAALNIAESAILGTYENPYDVATDEELAEVAADGIYVRIPEGTELTPPPGMRLVDAGNGIWKIEDTAMPATASAISVADFQPAMDGNSWTVAIKASEMLRGENVDWAKRTDLKVYMVYAETPQTLDANEGEAIEAEIVDDGTGDGTVKAMFEFGERLKSMRVIHMRIKIKE
ncbi:MAG: hypothetical protein II909_03340 [Kiritimatiellae bacterium]|nr:hypothetical protein [Kiritimatiellia bacterium]